MLEADVAHGSTMTVGAWIVTISEVFVVHPQSATGARTDY